MLILSIHLFLLSFVTAAQLDDGDKMHADGGRSTTKMRRDTAGILWWLDHGIEMRCNLWRLDGGDKMRSDAHVRA